MSINAYLINTDTITALSSPPGIGAISIVRLSGPMTLEIIKKIFANKKPLYTVSHTIQHGWLKDEEKWIDEVLISLFLSPNSYTGEDCCEIYCHGSPFITQKIIQLIILKGGRLAKPGEFTLRAFMNKKLDLAQAESVADLISAETEISYRTAIQTIRGGFSDEIKNLRRRIIDMASLLELELDFSEEDIEFVNRNKLKELLTDLIGKVSELKNSFQLGNVLKNGIPVVIAGKPNAGKSTLLNMILNEDKAIVSEIPGTTRDVIEDVKNINGILFRFMDTAGIREARDKIESLGIEKTFQKIRQSSLIVYVFDISITQPEGIKMELEALNSGEIPVLLIANKFDLLKNEKDLSVYQKVKNILFISANDLSKTDTYNKLINSFLFSVLNLNQIQSTSVIVSNLRHFDCLLKTENSLQSVMNGINNKISNELIASNLRNAMYHLSEITGDISNEDILKNIFEKFCVGK